MLVFAPYITPHIGGVENYIEEFASYSAKNRFQSIIFAPKLPLDTPEIEIREEEIRILRYPAFEIVRNYPFPKLWSFRFWKLLSIIQQEKPERVISHTRFFFPSFLALLFAKIHRIPWIHIEHGSSSVVVSNTLISFLSKIYDSTLGKLIFRFSNKNISISSDVQRFIRKFDNRLSPVVHRGIIFDNIIKLEALSPSNGSKKKNGTIRIVSVGRLTKLKGFKEAIIAIRKLPASAKKRVSYEIIGDGEEHSSLESIRQDDYSIHLLGPLPRQSVLEKLLYSDIFIHASLPGGGLATTLLEAMACGCAVIATPHEGSTDVIHNGKNGILIKDASPKAIREAILDLLENNAKRNQLAETGKHDVRSNFSWESTGKKLLEIIENTKQ